jgi:hypothetical protein
MLNGCSGELSVILLVLRNWKNGAYGRTILVKSSKDFTLRVTLGIWCTNCNGGGSHGGTDRRTPGNKTPLLRISGSSRGIDGRWRVKGTRKNVLFMYGSIECHRRLREEAKTSTSEKLSRTPAEYRSEFIQNTIVINSKSMRSNESAWTKKKPPTIDCSAIGETWNPLSGWFIAKIHWFAVEFNGLQKTDALYLNAGTVPKIEKGNLP